MGWVTVMMEYLEPVRWEGKRSYVGDDLKLSLECILITWWIRAMCSASSALFSHLENAQASLTKVMGFFYNNFKSFLAVDLSLQVITYVKQTGSYQGCLERFRRA